MQVRAIGRTKGVPEDNQWGGECCAAWLVRRGTETNQRCEWLCLAVLFDACQSTW